MRWERADKYLPLHTSFSYSDSLFPVFFLISMHINFRSTHTLQYTNRLFVFPPVPPHRETYIPFLFSEYTYAWKIFFCSCYNRSEHFWQLSHHSRLARSSIQQRLSCPEILLTHIMPYLETKASVLFLTALGFFPRTPLTAIHTVAFKKKKILLLRKFEKGKMLVVLFVSV